MIELVIMLFISPSLVRQRINNGGVREGCTVWPFSINPRKSNYYLGNMYLHVFNGSSERRAEHADADYHFFVRLHDKPRRPLAPTSLSLEPVCGCVNVLQHS